VQHTNASVAYVKVGGNTYPAVNERRCRTCRHPQRLRLETEVIAGRPWSAVIDDLPPGSGLTARALRNHFVRGHLPVREATAARLAVQQAAERGQVVAAGTDRLVEHASFANSVLGRVSHLLLSGQATPTIRDGLAAAALLARVEQTQPAFTEEDFLRASFVIFDAAKALLPDDLLSEFLHRISAHPATRELSQRWEQLHDTAPRFSTPASTGSVTA
jgi:hypothetical protein